LLSRCGRRFSGCLVSLRRSVRVGGLAAALWTKLGGCVTRAGLGAGLRVRTVPVAFAFGYVAGRCAVSPGCNAERSEFGSGLSRAG
jgi:hypothetical protein